MNESSNAKDQGAEDGPPTDGQTQPPAQEPSESFSGSDYEFAEPQLAAAEISEDVAESVDLQAAAAEAARVEHEAELAAQGVSASFSEPAPISQKSPSTHESAVPESDLAAAPDPSSVTSESTSSASSASSEAVDAEPVDWDSATTDLRTDFSQPPGANNPATQPAESANEPAAAPEMPDTPPSAPLGLEPPAQPPAVPAPQPSLKPPYGGMTSQGPDSANESSPSESSATASGSSESSMTAGTQQGAGSTAAPEAAHTFGHGVDDGHGWRRPETQWQQSATPWQPKAGAWQSPAQIARGEADAAAAAASAPNAPTPDAGQQNPYAQPAAAQAPYGAPTQHGAPAFGGPPSSGTSGAQPTPGVPPVPGQFGGPQGPGGPGDSQGGGNKKLFIIIGVALVGVALLGLLLWLVISLIFNNGSNNTESTQTANQSQEQTPGQAETVDSGVDPTTDTLSDTDLILASVSPLKWLEGDCLRDFTTASAPADVVYCSSPHDAQLVGAFYYEDSDEFPGLDALKAKAKEVCDNVTLTTEAASIKTLTQSTAYPTENTWNNSNDRRVDCLVRDTRGGNPLDISLTE